MKILQTPVRFYPFIGGVENYVYYLGKEQIELGNEVKVVCAGEPVGLKDREIVDGIEVRRLNYFKKIANTNVTPGLPLRLLSEDFDILHTHLPTPWSADWSALVSKIKKKPLVLTYHNDIVGGGFASYIAKTYNHTLLKYLLKRADKIIITQKKYLSTSSYLGGYEDKVKVIPVGVDTERFKPLGVEKEEKTLFFLSLLDEFHMYKGLDHLIKALKVVKSEIPDVRLIVGGKGNLMAYYREMSESLDLKDVVEYAGFIPDEEMVRYYNRCDAFVLPSISSEQEGFGIVLLEAMASGKPVIATDIVGVAEDVKKRDAGRIVGPGDEKALAGAIIEILEDEDLMKRMGTDGRRLVEEKYTWKRVAEMTQKVYNDVTSRREREVN
ncbi:MAG: glycosyltransferase family 4 protein [Halobacteriota archaeon]|nr:glycosyltransferase family 4 protein [Halobacteriota archaeon]